MSVDRITLVTGGSRGIGAAAAKLCAKAGHAVAVNFLTNADKAEAVAAEIRDAGGLAITLQADTGDEVQVERMFDDVTSELGPITGLVNNAGVHGPRGRLDELTKDQIQAVLSTKVLGCFLCARAAVKRMSTKHGGSGGAIVNVSSGSANLGAPNDGILYAASKGALNSLTIGLSQEVAREGIRVNTVAPGLTKTEVERGPERLELAKTIVANQSIPRQEVPDDLVGAVLFFASDDARFITGQTLAVSGGLGFR